MHLSKWQYLEVYWNWLSDRHNLYFSYQCRYYLWLYSELCMNTSNHYQFYIFIVTLVLISFICHECDRLTSNISVGVAERSKALGKRWCGTYMTRNLNYTMLVPLSPSYPIHPLYNACKNVVESNLMQRLFCTSLRIFRYIHIIHVNTGNMLDSKLRCVVHIPF